MNDFDELLAFPTGSRGMTVRMESVRKMRGGHQDTSTEIEQPLERIGDFFISLYAGM